MNCRQFESRLESLLDSRLTPAEREASLQHAESCPACRELMEAVADPTLTEETAPQETLVESILAATVGSVCDRARQQLPAFVDRELTGDDRRLVEIHLASCDGCRRLEATLVSLTTELPKLAEEAPDLRFTRDVLAATSQRRPPAWTWLKTHGSAWIQRPRFAMEAAYVGVLALMLVLGAFSTPVAALPQRGVELIQSAPDTPSIWVRTQEGLGTFWDSVASLFEKAGMEPESTEETP